MVYHPLENAPLEAVDWKKMFLLRYQWEESYPFLEPDSSSNIRFVEDESHLTSPRIAALSIFKLIEQMTRPRVYDFQLVWTAKVAHTSFISTEDLIELLILRFEFLFGITKLSLSRFQAPNFAFVDLESKKSYSSDICKPIQLRQG
jgi:hypothetical protein